MIQNNLEFQGNKMEDLKQHLKWFLQFRDTFKYNVVIDAAIHLRLFPFSLFEYAYEWLDL